MIEAINMLISLLSDTYLSLDVSIFYFIYGCACCLRSEILKARWIETWFKFAVKGKNYELHIKDYKSYSYYACTCTVNGWCNISFPNSNDFVGEERLFSIQYLSYLGDLFSFYQKSTY